MGRIRRKYWWSPSSEGGVGGRGGCGRMFHQGEEWGERKGGENEVCNHKEREEPHGFEFLLRIVEPNGQMSSRDRLK